MMRFVRIAPFAAALVWLLASVATAQDPEESKVLLELQPPVYDTVKRVISMAGSSNLPEKAVLSCQVSLGDNIGPRCQALVVKGGKFNFVFPAIAKKVILIPGSYRFEVICNPQDQVGQLRDILATLSGASGSAEVVIGDLPEATAIAEKLHSDLAELVKQTRALYMVTESTASFTVARIFLARTKAGGNLSDQEAERIMSGWQDYATQHFEENYRLLNLNFRDYKESTYITPYSAADRDIETLLNLVRKWYAVSWLELAEMVGAKLPKGIKEEANFPKRILLPQLDEATKRVYVALQAEPQDWVQVTAFRPEEGIIDGLNYMSKTSKFSISLPNEDWTFNKDMVHPQVRMRLTHKDNAKKDWGVVAVELRDYPECERPPDLDIAVGIDASERWPGYKRIRGGPIRVADSAMEDGKRPGFDLSFLAVATDKKRFHIIDYALYCRWYKRTYSVIMISDEEHYEEFAKAFDKIKQSFKVLDKE